MNCKNTFLLESVFKNYNVSLLFSVPLSLSLSLSISLYLSVSLPLSVSLSLLLTATALPSHSIPTATNDFSLTHSLYLSLTCSASGEWILILSTRTISDTMYTEKAGMYRPKKRENKSDERCVISHILVINILIFLFFRSIHACFLSVHGV